MEELQMPSTVTDRKFISFPSGNVVESDEEWSLCGKWILTHHEGDMDFLDRAWVDLQPLLEDGTLILLKASTAMQSHEGAFMQCFTRPEMEVVKRAASEIRRLVDFRGIMFYKSNRDSEAGKSNRQGHSRVSTYMHTYLGRFYWKSALDSWMPDNEDGEREVSPRSQFYRQNCLAPEQLPSTSRERVLRKGDDGQGNPNWFVFCSCIEEDGPPEIDRLWVVGEGLLAEGRLAGLRASKGKCNGEVRFYPTPDSGPAASQLQWLCDRVFGEAGVRGIMYHTTLGYGASLYFERTTDDDNTHYYFRRTHGGRKIPVQRLPGGREVRGSENGKHVRLLHDFIYTSNGELYKSARFGDVFVSSRSGAS